MIDLWDDEMRCTWPRWRTWGDGPLVVGRPPDFYSRRASDDRPGVGEGWAVFHVRTGRPIDEMLRTSVRETARRFALACVFHAGATFWTGAGKLRPGEHLRMPDEVLKKAMTAMLGVDRAEARREVAGLRESLADLDSRVAHLGGVDAIHATKARKLRRMIERAKGAL